MVTLVTTLLVAPTLSSNLAKYFEENVLIQEGEMSHASRPRLSPVEVAQLSDGGGKGSTGIRFRFGYCSYQAIIDAECIESAYMTCELLLLLYHYDML